MNIVLFEDEGYVNLLPLTWLRPAFELRCGRDRLIDKLKARLDGAIARVLLRPELEAALRGRIELSAALADAPWTFVNGRILATAKTELPAPGTMWLVRDALLAATVSKDVALRLTADDLLQPRRRSEWVGVLRPVAPPESVRLIDYPWDLIAANGAELRNDLIKGGNHEGSVYPGAHLINPTQIAIAKGATVKPGAVLDAETGPIEIDRDARIEPNAVIQGPCYIGEHSIVRPTALIREDTSLGPQCRVGGEVEASIFQGFSNKQHDGFVGHSFIASWVNLGADTVTSDLKNTYGSIRVSLNGVGIETGRHFLGSIIGDHAKTGIGTILGTGTILGVAANVFTQGSVAKFVPSFAWLTEKGMEPCRVEKIVSIARTVMGRRKVQLSSEDERLLECVARAAKQVEVMGWTAGAERELRTAF